MLNFKMIAVLLISAFSSLSMAAGISVEPRPVCVEAIKQVSDGMIVSTVEVEDAKVVLKGRYSFVDSKTIRIKGLRIEVDGVEYRVEAWGSANGSYLDPICQLLGAQLESQGIGTGFGSSEAIGAKDASMIGSALRTLTGNAFYATLYKKTDGRGYQVSISDTNEAGIYTSISQVTCSSTGRDSVNF